MLGRRGQVSLPARKEWDRDVWGWGKTRPSLYSCDRFRGPSYTKGSAGENSKRQAESETRAERDQSWVPIEMLPVALTPPSTFFSASPFHRQNTEAPGS